MFSEPLWKIVALVLGLELKYLNYWLQFWIWSPISKIYWLQFRLRLHMTGVYNLCIEHYCISCYKTLVVVLNFNIAESSGNKINFFFGKCNMHQFFIYLFILFFHCKFIKLVPRTLLCLSHEFGNETLKKYLQLNVLNCLRKK